MEWMFLYYTFRVSCSAFSLCSFGHILMSDEIAILCVFDREIS